MPGSHLLFLFHICELVVLVVQCTAMTTRVTHVRGQKHMECQQLHEIFAITIEPYVWSMQAFFLQQKAALASVVLTSAVWWFAGVVGWSCACVTGFGWAGASWVAAPLHGGACRAQASSAVSSNSCWSQRVSQCHMWPNTCCWKHNVCSWIELCVDVCCVSHAVSVLLKAQCMQFSRLCVCCL